TSTCFTRHLACTTYTTMRVICKVIMDKRDEAYTASPMFAAGGAKRGKNAPCFGALPHYSGA
ncbi:MAG: hypothetical protein RR376_21065, partial [Janthinobacterium sp.]